MSLKIRVLPPEEWPRVVAAGIEPFATSGLPDPQHWRMIVAENDVGQIVGLSGLYETVHNDPWWIAPAYRGHPTLMRRLWQQTREILDDHQVTVIHVTVSDDLPEVKSMVERLGYTPSPGTLYIMHVDRCVLNKE